nr:MAG TPA: hypothetical protein [Microviridae sp.]
MSIKKLVTPHRLSEGIDGCTGDSLYFRKKGSVVHVYKEACPGYFDCSSYLAFWSIIAYAFGCCDCLFAWRWLIALLSSSFGLSCWCVP